MNQTLLPTNELQKEHARDQLRAGTVSSGNSRNASNSRRNASNAANAARKVTYLRDLFVLLLNREMKLMYKRSALGVAWTYITPLLQLLSYTFLFSVILQVQIDKYASFALIGLLVWNWFQASVQQASRSITDGGSLLSQPGFPSAILPPGAVATWLMHFLLALPALAVVLFFNGVHLTPYALLLPVIIAVQILFSVSLAYPLAALSVAFRDTNHILTIILNLAMPLTPIFYDAKVLPERYRWFFELNPVWHLIDAYRAVLLRGELPSFSSILSPLLISACLLPIGYLFFKRQSARFLEEL